MNRRKFLAAAAAAPFAGRLRFLSRADAADLATATASVNALPDWRRFEVTTRVTLPGNAGASQLWLPPAQTAGGYQAVLDLHWQGNGHTERVHGGRFGAQILRTIWDGKGGDASHQIEVVQTIATLDRTASPFLPITDYDPIVYGSKFRPPFVDRPI